MPKPFILLPFLCVLCGCAFNAPKFNETIAVTATNGVTTTTTRTLRVPSFALWPATTTIDKQRASLGKTFSLGTTGINEDGGGTNMVEALKALSELVKAVKVP